VIDPICDMTVEPASAAGKFDYDGETYYFCSVHCQKLFQTDPAKYLSASKARRGAQATPQAVHPQHHPAAVKPESRGAIYLPDGPGLPAKRRPRSAAWLWTPQFRRCIDKIEYTCQCI
jgi:YHS domain-containing protein